MLHLCFVCMHKIRLTLSFSSSFCATSLNSRFVVVIVYSYISMIYNLFSRHIFDKVRIFCFSISLHKYHIWCISAPTYCDGYLFLYVSWTSFRISERIIFCSSLCHISFLKYPVYFVDFCYYLFVSCIKRPHLCAV